MNKDYLEQLSQIKSIMEERTQFHFLSGISGILAGSFALIGAYLAYRIIYTADHVLYDDLRDLSFNREITLLVFIFLSVLLLSILSGIYFSRKKAKAANSQLWNPAAIKVLFNFSIPMLVGAVFIFFLWKNQYLFLISSSSLLFYGLALIHAANFTFSDVKKLGMTITAIGLISLAFPGQGLLFWSLGFGVAHILYGSLMYFKYER